MASTPSTSSDPRPARGERQPGRRRASLRLPAGLAHVAAALAAAAAVASLLVLVAGADPVAAARGLVEGAAGDRYRVAETVVQAVPLALVALGVSVALRAGVFVVGAEGQLICGAVAATAVVLAVPGAPAPVLIALGLVAGAAGGALWALGPALLRARLGVNEILSTLLANYLAAWVLAYLLRTGLRDPDAVATPQSDDLPDGALLPTLLDGTRLHCGVAAVLVAAVALAWWVRSPRGFAIDVFGERPRLAQRMGVRPARAIVGTMLVAGAAAGVAGWIQVAGVDGKLYTSVAGGLGFLGIVVAVLGTMRPLGILLAALLFGALTTGADGLQVADGVPATLAGVIQAVLLLAVAVAVARRRGGRPAASAPEQRQAPAEAAEEVRWTTS